MSEISNTFTHSRNNVIFCRHRKYAMVATMDWPKIIRELRLLTTQLQTDRFYALYLLLGLMVFAYLTR